MRLYRPEYIADLAKLAADRRERAKIARAGEYTVKFIEGMLSKRRRENEDTLKAWMCENRFFPISSTNTEQ